MSIASRAIVPETAVYWLLLFVLAANAALPAFTADWLQFLPGHDHLFFGKPHPGWEDHEHGQPRQCRYSLADARALNGEDAPLPASDGVLSLYQMPSWGHVTASVALWLAVQDWMLPTPAALPHTVDLAPPLLTNRCHPPPEQPPRLSLS